MILKPVDTVITVTLGPAIDDTDFKSQESVAYNAAGIDVVLFQETTNGVSATSITPSNTDDASHNYWAHVDSGMHKLRITAAQNDTEGVLWVVAYADGVLTFESPRYEIVPANVYNSLVLGTDTLDANVKEISDDATAADNLESTYDGTGYTDEYAPAQQHQLDAIAVTAAALNTPPKAEPDGFVITVGTSETNDEDSTHALDGTYHTLSSAGGEIDCYYNFEISGDGTPVSVTMTGRVNSKGDDLAVYANAGTVASPNWVQIGTLEGTNLSADSVNVWNLFTSHVDAGTVQIRFHGTGLSSAVLRVDQIFVSYAAVTRSAGYSDGAIWIDTVNGTAGTEDYINGTADRPVNSWADALTISASLGIKKFHVFNGSTITLSGATEDYTLVGNGWTLVLNGQSIANSHIEGATVSGVSSGSGAHFVDCTIGTASFEAVSFSRCQFTGGTITLLSAGTYMLIGCGCGGGASPTVFDFGAGVGDTMLLALDWSGGIELANLGASGTDKAALLGSGMLIIGATCSGGTIHVHGPWTLTDNVAGGFAGTLDDDAKLEALAKEATLATHDTDIKALEPHGTPMRGTDNAALDATAAKEATLATHDKVVKGAVAGKSVLSADKKTRELYDADGHLLVTLVYDEATRTWTPTWA